MFIIDSYLTGGAERSLLEISSRLKKFSPIVCVLDPRKSDLKAQFLLRKIPLIELNVRSRFWWIEGVIKLKKTLAEVKPDLVHATLFKSELVTRLTLFGTTIPHIGSFVNDSYSRNRYSHQSFIRNVKLNFIRLIDGITAQSVPRFMAITQTIADTNAKALFIDHKKITCIYRGRNINDFMVSHPPPTDHPFRFLTIARLLKRKGYLELFDAVKILQDKGRKFIIRVAGKGDDYSLFIEVVTRLEIQDKIQFLLSRDDVPALLADAHCFIFPSHYEGQGGALVEAMLAAKPIIASDIPVFREQISGDQSGKLFQLFNSRDLAEKMEWMMDQYAAGIALGLEARKIAIERFNIENTVRMHEELYTNMLANNGRRV
jgi:glycosyltransferase involved in cell wall biosynthesis